MTLSRRDAVRDLVEWRVPVTESLRRLAGFPWDSDDELVQMTRGHVSSVLRRFLNGEVSAQAVEDWAEAVFMRDDIGFGEPPDEVLKEALFELSTPELGHSVDEIAEQWLEQLTP